MESEKSREIEEGRSCDQMFERNKINVVVREGCGGCRWYEENILRRMRDENKEHINVIHADDEGTVRCLASKGIRSTPSLVLVEGDGRMEQVMPKMDLQEDKQLMKALLGVVKNEPASEQEL